MKRHKPAHTQLQLDYSIRKKMFRMAWPINGHVKHLMRVLEDFAGVQNDVCSRSFEEIALAMSVSVATVGRAMKTAIEKGLVFELKRRSKQTASKRYRIRRANYQELAREETERLRREGKLPERFIREHFGGELTLQDERSTNEFTAQPARSTGEFTAQVARSTRSSPRNLQGQRAGSPSRLRGQLDGRAGSHLFMKEEYNSSPPFTAARVEWEEVEEAFERFGLGASRDATRLAKESGCSPEHVLQLVAWAETHRADWDSPEGVLFARVRNAKPSQAVSDGWLPPNPNAIARRKAEATREAEANRRAVQQAEEDAQAAKMAADAERQRQLEAEFGMDLDTMPKPLLNEVVLAALAGHPLMLDSWRRRPELDRMTRPIILRHMAKTRGVGVGS